MAVSRSLHIQFLLVTPHHKDATWPPDRYPWDKLNDMIDGTEPKRREQTVGIGHRVTSETHRSGAHRLLSIHNIDVAARRTEAEHGSIRVTEFDETGGPTAASHLLHLERDVFGLARETGGPGPTAASNYIGVLAGGYFDALFHPIARADGIKRLRRMTEATSVTIGMATSPIKGRALSNPFMQALQAATEHLDADEVRMTVSVKRNRTAQRRWLDKNRDALEDFLESDRAAITEAKVGAERLLEASVTATAYVSNTRGAVDPDDAVHHIRDEYRQQRDEIQESLGRRP